MTSARAWGVTVVDVDSHVYEPEDIWSDYLPAAIRERARRAFSRTGATFLLNGSTVRGPGRSAINRQAIWRPGMSPASIGRLDPSDPPEPNRGAWDPRTRLADMDVLGVDQAVVLPPLFAEFLPSVDDAEAAAALARAYNDWAVDFASRGDGRLHP